MLLLPATAQMGHASHRRLALFLSVVCLIAGGKDCMGQTAAEPPETPKTQLATLGGGCFWCTEAVFELVKGVQDVVSGYSGGHVPNPTYELVLTKKTGHAEVVQILFDPDQVSFAELLEVFFKTHDPTTLNQQGADVGPQYRSVIFYHDEEQKRIAQEYIEQLQGQRAFRSPIVTEVSPFSRFYRAEEYHQDFFAKNPGHGYCQAVVAAKVRKFQTSFPEKVNR
jgi:peptide-methionine (S)-S-oxide reductase